MKKELKIEILNVQLLVIFKLPHYYYQSDSILTRILQKAEKKKQDPTNSQIGELFMVNSPLPHNSRSPLKKNTNNGLGI